MTKRELQDKALLLLAALELGDRSDIFRLTKLEFLHRDRVETGTPGGAAPFSGSFYRQKYGPYSPEVYNQTEELAAAGFLEVKGHRGRQRITSKGIKVAEALRTSTDPKVVEQVREIAESMRSLSFNEIKELCYRKFATWAGRAIPVGELEIGDPVHPAPRNWLQVIPDEVLLDFAATIEASKPYRILSDRSGVADLERAMS